MIRNNFIYRFRLFSSGCATDADLLSNLSRKSVQLFRAIFFALM